MRRAIWPLSLALAITLQSSDASAQTARDSADAAWRAGSNAEAFQRYSRILAADSADGIAMHRVALMHAWAERYAESITMLDRLIRMQPRNAEARLDRARVLAWSGDTKSSIATIDSLLVADPRNVDAMQVRAQFLSWAGNYDDALRSYDRILEISPESRAARIDRARVLSWAENFDAATAAYEALLQRDPTDREALLGLGNVLALTSQHDSASAIFTRLLAINADDIDAMRGLARAATWQGHLREGEKLWREALAKAPSNVDVQIGLAQALRWQGRDAAAFEVLEKTRIASPGRLDVIEQMRWVDLAMAPRANPALSYESDSDNNRITTASLSAAFRPLHRLELRGDAYRRHAAVSNGGGAGDAYGTSLGAWIQFEPGWSATVNVGANTNSGTDAVTRGTFRAAVTTPGRYTSALTAAFGRSIIDGTAALITRQVYVDEFSLDASTALRGFSVSAAAGTASFKSKVSGQSNGRWSLLGAVTRPVARGVVIGLRTRAFGFDDDLNDAYFDPDFYGLAEITARYLRESAHWSLSFEAAPGVQQVRSTGDPSASYRAATRIGYILKPGRNIAVNAAWAKSGLQQLSPAAGADYSYRAIGISAGWSF